MKRIPGRASVLLAVTAAATVLVAGCGAGEQPGDGGTSPASASSSTAGQRPTGTVGPTAGTPSSTSTAARPTPTRIDTHLTGTAVRGVEPGCVGIKAKGKTYQLAGDEPRELAKERGYGQRLGRVKVSGHFAPKGAASTCMMGRVFVVVKMEKL